MHHPMKKSLFGYKRDQVEACLDALDKQIIQQQTAYEERIKQVAEENIRLAVELNVARSGYKDAAELMVAAQSRARDLERYLEAERQRVGRLEQQLTASKQAQATASVTAMIQSLKEHITALEEASLQTQKIFAQPYGDGTRFEKTDFMLPEGIDTADREADNARGLMQRLYQSRTQEHE